MNQTEFCKKTFPLKTGPLRMEKHKPVPTERELIAIDKKLQSDHFRDGTARRLLAQGTFNHDTPGSLVGGVNVWPAPRTPRHPRDHKRMFYFKSLPPLF